MAHADLIVTFNLRDFPLEALSPFGIEAQSPDHFLGDLVDAATTRIRDVLVSQAADLHDPPATITDGLAALSVTIPIVARRLQVTLTSRTPAGRYDMDDDEAFRRLVARVLPGGSVVRRWTMTGGVSALVTGLEVARGDGERVKLLVRRHGEVDWTFNPRIARDEFRLLEIARAHGVAAPKPWYVDESGEVPCLVVEYIEGETVFDPRDVGGWVTQAAAGLARIHHVKDSDGLGFLPRQDKGFGEQAAALDVSLDEERIQDTLEPAWPLTQVNPPVLLHGDYWPGNWLWSNSILVAVIDWEDARTGDPLADLGNCRLELLWSSGIEAMDAFTTHYRALTGVDVTNLPYWDLVAALRPCGKIADWGLDEQTEARMRERHRWFVSRAIDAIEQHRR